MSDEQETRTVVVSVRVTAAEHAAWKQAAKADGRTLASWIVRRCNGDPTTAPTAPAKRAKRAR